MRRRKEGGRGGARPASSAAKSRRFRHHTIRMWVLRKEGRAGQAVRRGRRWPGGRFALLVATLPRQVLRHGSRDPTSRSRQLAGPVVPMLRAEAAAAEGPTPSGRHSLQSGICSRLVDLLEIACSTLAERR